MASYQLLFDFESVAGAQHGCCEHGLRQSLLVLQLQLGKYCICHHHTWIAVPSCHRWLMRTWRTMKMMVHLRW